MFELFFKYSRDTFAHAGFVFASGWPIWLLAVLIVLAAVAVAASLARLHRGLSFPRRVTLGALQWAALALALALLWRPALVTQTLKPKQNSVAVLLDTSASMGYGEGQESRLQQAVVALDSKVLPALRRKFDVNLHGFAGDMVDLQSLSKVPAPGSQTHIAQGLLSVLRSARSTALGAVVLVSDGGDNSQAFDAAQLAEIASFGVPVDTVGVGREVLPEDVELEDVRVPVQALAGTTVNAEVSIRHARGGTATLKVYDGDAILASQVVTLSNQPGITTQSVDIPIRESGLKDLQFTVVPLAGERNVANNTQSRPMRVPDSKRSVLYVEGEPRWEYKFIRRAADESPVRLASLLRTTPNKYYRQGINSPDELADGFPTDAATLFKYDALIIGSDAASTLSKEQQELIKEFVDRRGGALLMLGGRRGLGDGGWGATVVADVLPAQLPADQTMPSFTRKPAKAVLTDAGARSPITRIVEGVQANREAWASMPDIADFQHIGPLKPGAVTLLEAGFGGSVEPLLVEQHYGLGNAYILATGGTWRWQMQLPHEDLRHETFWRQLLQTMAASAVQQVTLSSARVFYADESRVTLQAEVRNDQFEPVDDATVTMSVTGPDGASTINLNRVAGEPGVFSGVYDAGSPGLYRFDATASSADGTVLGSAQSVVRRADNVAEHFHLEQNKALLQRIAAATGGRYFSLANVGELPDAVRFSTAGIVERQTLDLWNMPAVFLLLLGLKAAEWLLRLRWGRL